MLTTMKVGLAQINPTVGAIDENSEIILNWIKRASSMQVDLLLFPEMALIGYPPEDLLYYDEVLTKVEESVLRIASHVPKNMLVVLGAIRRNQNPGQKPLYNSAAVCQGSRLLGWVDKQLLPEYDVFTERRYFAPGQASSLFSFEGKKIGVMICEDLYAHGDQEHYAFDPVVQMKEKKPDLVVNLSASPFYRGRMQERFAICLEAAKTLNAPYLLCNQVGGNDSLIFDGQSLIVTPKGCIASASAFEEELLVCSLFDKEPISLPAVVAEEQLYQALVLGIRDYFRKLGFQRACLGISGGIDSAVTAVLAVDALGSEHVHGIGMPSRYTSYQSLEDAKLLSSALGIELEMLSIEPPFKQLLDLLEHPGGITEENLQSRLRGLLLMAHSNQTGSLVLSTGNKSELALGYSTLYGDLCGGLAVLADLTKGEVYELAHFLNRSEERIPTSILQKPPSAELRHDQKDSDSLPPYEVIDQVIVDYVELHLSLPEIVEKRSLPFALVEELVHKMHLAEYKRRQAPPGLKISRRAFSVGRRFPIVQRWR